MICFRGWKTYLGRDLSSTYHCGVVHTRCECVYAVNSNKSNRESGGEKMGTSVKTFKKFRKSKSCWRSGGGTQKLVSNRFKTILITRQSSQLRVRRRPILYVQQNVDCRYNISGCGASIILSKYRGNRVAVKWPKVKLMGGSACVQFHPTRTCRYLSIIYLT